MSQYNIGICDDEERMLPIIRRAVIKEFEQHGVSVTVSIFHSPAELELAHAREPFSLLFLDIAMPETDGILLARKLRRNSPSLKIVFVSSRSDLVFESLSVHPFCFIRKSRFSQEISGIVSDLILEDRLKKQLTLTVTAGSEVHTIPIGMISYIECIRKDQYIHTSDEIFLVHYSLNYFEDRLLLHGFLKPHKSFLVNYQYIRHIRSEDILLITGETVPLSRLKRMEIRQEFLRMMM